MKKNLNLSIIFVSLFIQIAYAQTISVSKVEPPNWWGGMKYNKIQIMLYGENLDGVNAKSSSPAFRIIKVNKTDNPSYAFIDVELANNIKPGNYLITLTKGESKTEVTYPVLQRLSREGRFQGFSQKDVIYLITPDRFADGDSLNNNFAGMIDHYDLKSPYRRHGGDIQGMINNLDYLKDLGVTAIWVNPLLENNQELSYHGYGITDLYKIDPRYGTNEQYARFVEEAHKRGLKVIWDHVTNHIGVNHQWMNNLPIKDWTNGTKQEHHITPHFNRSNFDIHSPDVVAEYNTTGWFVDEMPDVNTKNPFVSKYYIQNTLWWMEYTGQDGIREDTYPYNYLKHMSEWNKAIFAEYPATNVVGEVWIGDPVALAPYQKGSFFPKKYDSNLPVVTDFAFRDEAEKVFQDSMSIRHIYDLFARDILYADPYSLLTFLDNHDIARIMYLTRGNVQKAKLALQLLLTARGIPQIYMGTEIGIMGGPSHVEIRQDFPGGFPNSTHNAFIREGRTPAEEDMFKFTQQMLNIRKNNPALSEGKFSHIPPIDEMYLYFRETAGQRVFVILNNNKVKKTFNTAPFALLFGQVARIKDLKTGAESDFKPGQPIEIGAYDSVIYELK